MTNTSNDLIIQGPLLSNISAPSQELPIFVEAFFQDGLKLLKKKNSDYGSITDPVANFSIEGWFGVITRMQDKMSRLYSIREKMLLGEPLTHPKETILDTLQDLSNYAAVCAFMYESEQLGRWKPIMDTIASKKGEQLGNTPATPTYRDF
jgi:hypothetical protein